MQSTAHILVIEDDSEIQKLVAGLLSRSGWKTTLAKNGKQANAALSSHNIDLVLLDIMLPGEDGLSICQRLRATSNIPIIIVSARGDDIDRVIGLEIGADDYLAKPFNPRELQARIKAMLRRSRMSALNQVIKAEILYFGGWRMNAKLRELTDSEGIHIHLTPGEFELLRVFCERPGVPLSREQLLDLTQGSSTGSTDRSIDILVSRLRRKIESDNSSSKVIHTVRSGGYEFIADVTDQPVP